MKTKSQETRNSILSATLELIAEQGFHGTSVSQIAERANVNVGSMYYHFTNKEEILSALYLDCKSRMTEYAFHDYSNSTPADESLKMMLRNVIHFCAENKAAFFFIEQYENSPYMASFAGSEKYREIMRRYMDLFNRSITDGLVKDLPLGVYQSLLLGSISALTKNYINNKETISETVLLNAINAIWDMVKK